jgi:ACS family allantoate permease-like MFS transporter
MMSPKEEVSVTEPTGGAGRELNHVEYDDTEKHSADEKALDLAAHFLNGDHAYQYTEKEANAVKWKIDRHLMPVLFLTGMISAIDKTVISNAALYGMNKDLGISSHQFSWIGSIVAFGLLSMEWPVAFLIQRLPLSKLLPTAVVLWGLFTALIGAANNFSTIMALRFMLGMSEAAIFPSCQIYIVMMYKSHEQPIRISVYLAALSSLIVGPVSYGIGISTGSSIATWRLLYITFGGMTVVWGIITYFLLPDNPATWKVLSDREKYIAIHRVQSNQTGIENKTIKWYQVREAVFDPKTWVLFVYQVLIASYTGGLTTFASLIVNGFGFSQLETVLLGMPTGVFQTLSAFIYAYIATRKKNTRVITMMVTCLLPVMSTALIWQLPESNRSGRLAGYYLAYMFWGCYTVSASLPAMNTSGHSKKVSANAMTFVAYCVGTIIGPQYFQKSDNNGYIALMLSAAIAVPLAFSYMMICIWQNKRKDKAIAEGKFNFHESYGMDENLLDLTDKEKVMFRYQY